MPAWTVFLVLAFLGSSGCSGDQARRTAYETLHNMSDERNTLNPRYDSSRRESYDDYQRQRDENLKARNGERDE